MIVKKILYLFLFLLGQSALAQVTFIVNELPESPTIDYSIYISGDFENWTGGQEKYKLTSKNGTFFITIPAQEKSISYKFTQGSWNTVEQNITGDDIQNRNYIFKKNNDTVYVKIQNWQQGITKESTASCNVSILKEKFEIPQLNRKRDIRIYLPLNYQESNERYPVLYMHDGQNLFDAYTSYAGEWAIDETLDKLYENQNFKLIVIGIDNGQETRLNEYSPWDNSKYGKGEGKAYMQFIVNTLKPYVDKNYRTLPNKDNTAIMGSSMGGLISHYAALAYPEVFGKIGVFSPSFWYSKSSFEFTKHNAKNVNARMYYIVGEKEGKKMVLDMKKILRTLKKSGVNKSNLKQKVVKDGQHNEQFWKNEFEEAILWLFEKKQ